MTCPTRESSRAARYTPRAAPWNPSAERPSDERGGRTANPRRDPAQSARHVAHEPVVLVAVHPDGDRSARLEETEQSTEACVRIGQVVEHADGVHEVEATAVGDGTERRSQEISLHDPGGSGTVPTHVRAVSTASLRSSAMTSSAPNCAAKYACRPVPQPASSTRLPAKTLRADRMQPVEELRLELRVHLVEVLPLPAECRSSATLEVFEVERYEPRNAVADRPASAHTRLTRAHRTRPRPRRRLSRLSRAPHAGHARSSSSPRRIGGRG